MQQCKYTRSAWHGDILSCVVQVASLGDVPPLFRQAVTQCCTSAVHKSHAGTSYFCRVINKITYTKHKLPSGVILRALWVASATSSWHRVFSKPYIHTHDISRSRSTTLRAISTCLLLNRRQGFCLHGRNTYHYKLTLLQLHIREIYFTIYSHIFLNCSFLTFTECLSQQILNFSNIYKYYFHHIHIVLSIFQVDRNLLLYYRWCNTDGL